MKTLDLFGPVGEPWDGFTDKAIAKELGGYDGPLTVRINSPGGFAYDGIAIYNLLKKHEPHVEIVGLAASAASVIAMAGKTIEIATGAEFMIHDAWGLVMGGSDDMRGYADHLDKLSGSIADVYAERTGADKSAIREMMVAETWMSADEARAAGFADELGGESEPATESAQAVLAAMDCHNRLDKSAAKTAKAEMVRRAMLWKARRHAFS